MPWVSDKASEYFLVLVSPTDMALKKSKSKQFCLAANLRDIAKLENLRVGRGSRPLQIRNPLELFRTILRNMVTMFVRTFHRLVFVNIINVPVTKTKLYKNSEIDPQLHPI